MRFSAQVTSMIIATMLLPCGCEHHEPQATMLTTAVSVSEAIPSEAAGWYLRFKSKNHKIVNRFFSALISPSLRNLPISTDKPLLSTSK